MTRRRYYVALAVLAVAVVATLSGNSLAQQSGELAQVGEQVLVALENVEILVECVNEEAKVRAGVSKRDLEQALHAAVLGGNTVTISKPPESTNWTIEYTKSQIEAWRQEGLTGQQISQRLGWDKPRAPAMYLRVTLRPLNYTKSTFYDVNLSLREPVLPLRCSRRILQISPRIDLPSYLQEQSSMLTFAATWECRGTTGMSPDNEIAQQVKDIIRDMVDEFTIAWHEANPQGED